MALTASALACLRAFKFSVLLLCLAAFAWQVAESFLTYRKREVGTKVELRRNGDTDGRAVRFPSFAVCRNPYQVVDYWVGPGISLTSQYNVSWASDMSRLEGYMAVERSGTVFADVFHQHISNNSFSVSDVEIMAWDKHDNPSWPSYASSPHDGINSRHWRSDFHPFFGTCFVFSMESEAGAVAYALGAAGPSSVVVSVNLARAFPDLSPPPPPCDEERGDYCGPPVASPGDHIDAEHPDAYSVNIVAFYDGSFITTRQSLPLDAGARRYFSLRQRVVDRRDISDTAHCDPDTGYNEDDCLLRCLVEKTTSELGCLHPRVKVLLAHRPEFNDSCSNGTLDKVCTSVELFPLTAAAERRMGEDRRKFGLPPMENPDYYFTQDEYGVQLIRDLLARFAASQQYKREETEEEREGRRARGEEERCGCKMPCVQNILELAGVSDERDGDFSDFAFAYFQFGRNVDVFSYHYLYTGSNFVADFGGFLGLFLGLSVFTVVEVAVDFIDGRLAPKEQERKDSNISIGSKKSDGVLAPPATVYKPESRHSSSNHSRIATPNRWTEETQQL